MYVNPYNNCSCKVCVEKYFNGILQNFTNVDFSELTEMQYYFDNKEKIESNNQNNCIIKK